MDQPVQLPNSFRFPGYDKRMYLHQRGRVPRLNELDGVMINVTKCLHWMPRQISRYRDLCRHERLAVEGVVHRARIGKGERERYMEDLAFVFPEERGRQKKDGSKKQDGISWGDHEQQYKEEALDLKQISESSVEHFFPGFTPRERSIIASGTDEKRDDRLMPSGQPYHGPRDVEETEHNIPSTGQQSQSKGSSGTPGRARRAVQI